MVRLLARPCRQQVYGSVGFQAGRPRRREHGAAWGEAPLRGRNPAVGRGVRGKLLTANPWKAFNGIEGTDKPIRQFTAEELGSILDYFGSKWKEVAVAPAATKALLWLWCRLSELVNLKWDDLRIVGTEYHFEIVGKLRP